MGEKRWGTHACTNHVAAKYHFSHPLFLERKQTIPLHRLPFLSLSLPLALAHMLMWDYTGSLWQKSTLAQLSPSSAHSSSSPPPAPSAASSSSFSGSGKTSIAASCLVNERVNSEHVNGRGSERAAAAKHDWIWLLAQTSLRVAAQDDLVVSWGREEGGVRERDRGDSHILII